MNFQNNFTKQNSNIQEIFKHWDNKILPHLPDQIDEMAKRTGAIQRKRGVCSAIDLLRMLFLYASSKFSFRFRHAVSEIVESPREQAATARKRNENFELA